MKLLSILSLAAVLVIANSMISLSGASADPSRPGQTAAPDFGPNVLIFDPSMTNIQSQNDALFSRQERSQFGSNRYAYLFKRATRPVKSSWRTGWRKMWS